MPDWISIFSIGTIRVVCDRGFGSHKRNTAAPMPNIDCQKYFQRLGRPRSSSRSPVVVHPADGTEQQGNDQHQPHVAVERSAHSSVLMAMAVRIRAPPMVGAP